MFFFSVQQKRSDDRRKAWKMYSFVTENLGTRVKESEDPMKHPFLARKPGDVLATYSKLKKSATKNDQHARLINAFLRPACPSATILRNLLFSNQPEHFPIDGDGPGKVDYIVAKAYLDRVR